MGPVVGIDLGTTNTVVAVVRDGQPQAVADGEGHRLIPSVVSFQPNGVAVVGREAKLRRLQDPRNTVASIKRLIGRSWDAEEVQKARERFGFEMREGPGQAALVVARGETYTLPEISAFVLRKAKQIAEAALGETIERAVITVPANFNDLQRAATKVAGRVAGLEVLRILNEPTAAALAYGFGKATQERIAVFDFGGGTFDVTLLDLSDNVFEVLATAGNTFLGGDDIDLALADELGRQLLAQHRVDARTDPLVFERLRATAEELKCTLSERTEVALTLPEVAHGPGGKALDLSIAMSRAELERLARPIIERTFDTCREALSIARLEPSDFDQVLLVGGSTRIPLVRARVAEFFRREPLTTINPDEAIALGAALQAVALAGERKRTSSMPPAPRPARSTEPGMGRGGAVRIPATTAQGLGGARRTQPGTGRSTSPGVQNPAAAAAEALARAGRSTSPGVAAEEAPRGRPAAVVMPAATPGGAARTTAPRVADAGGPSTTPGLGARGKAVTGTGLGAFAARPAVPAAQAPAPLSVQGASSATSTPGGATLMSAGEAARSAQAKAAAVESMWGGDSGLLPLVGVGAEAAAASLLSEPPAPLPPPRTPAAVETGAPPGARPRAPAATVMSAQAPAVSPPPPLAASPKPPPATAPGAAAPPKVAATPPAPPVRPPPPPRVGKGTLIGAGAFTAPTAAPPLVAAPPPPPAAAPPPPPVAAPPPPPAMAAPPAPPVGAMAPVPPPWTTPALDAEPLPLGDDALEVEDSAPGGAEERMPDSVVMRYGDLKLTLPQNYRAGRAAPEASAAPPAPEPTPAAAPPPPMRPAAPTLGGLGGFDLPPPSPSLGVPRATQPLPAATAVMPAWVPPAVAPVIREMAPEAPVLVDVTPLSLAIETVNGFCDRVIARNTPVPCQQTRTFVTATDNQTMVRLRVSQGEASVFSDNTLLGAVELTGLRPAGRGQVQVAVTFALDTDGMLEVSARDVETGRQAQARLRLVGTADADEIRRLAARHAAHPTV